MARQTAFHPDDLKISGQDVMTVKEIPPGPEVGRIKQQLFEKVLEDPGLNTTEQLLEMLQDMD
jgi:hypothetical protein